MGWPVSQRRCIPICSGMRAVRQIVRQTKSLPLAQRQAGWTRLQPAYLSIGAVEAREMMRGLTD
jgi:hypothetical protein